MDKGKVKSVISTCHVCKCPYSCAIHVVFEEHTREVDYSDKSVTENTRAAYPIEYIPNAKIPCVAPHPKNVILLACDAFGVLPPVSKLSLAQTMYHFISGYTALVCVQLLNFGSFVAPNA
ncbi:phosphoenolpyruvate carboxykinase (ATP)-like [Eucalyptus grandis]|uniref:phosphoenolpyruvate carboxykinase (ATP)-like n=1 Tax=Eucalyptus grandis TaxID=71139 RepID=UPI00192EC818|nr:phosphoenolpyruvate carboxykinase (ATP)-like [Eucalyptus grandis]